MKLTKQTHLLNHKKKTCSIEIIAIQRSYLFYVEYHDQNESPIDIDKFCLKITLPRFSAIDLCTGKHVENLYKENCRKAGNQGLFLL